MTIWREKFALKIPRAADFFCGDKYRSYAYTQGRTQRGGAKV